MVILQMGVLDDRILLWGEKPVEPVPGSARRRRTKAEASGPQALPYDAGADACASALSEGAPGLTCEPKEAESAVLWLPTTSGGTPIASSPLVAEPPEPGAPLQLAPWTVTALPLPPDKAVALLGAASGRDTLAPGVVAGRSLAYLATALRFAGALVARQQFLPGVEKSGQTYRARWEPVFTGADTDRLAALARAMPDACRALARGTDGPPDTPPAEVLSAFLTRACDYLVRCPAAPGETALPAPRRRGKAPAPAFDSLHSLHDQWLHALRAPDGHMDGDAGELARFAASVREWRRPLSVSLAAPFKLCFRLEEPEEGETDAWYVRYLLQAADDPSLLVPAEKAWAARGRTASLLKRDAFQPREYLLSSLGYAARVCPDIEQSMKTPAPGGYALDTNGAHRFLTEQAWLLEGAGFGVLLPAWWTRKGTKLRLATRAHVKPPKMQANAGLSLESLVDVDWEVALGDQSLSLPELRKLARQKASLVKVRGQWVQLDADEIQAALDFWNKRQGAQAPARDVVRMALGLASTPGGIPFEGVTATGWVAEFLSQLEGSAALEEAPLPDGFRATLRPYQLRGYSWMTFLRKWGLGACLADDMGLGKTPQTLALLHRHWQAGERRPTLVVCPTSVVGNWQKEADRFAPELPVLVHHGLGRARGPALVKEASEHAVVLSSFALLHRDFETLKEVPWAAVVLDEAQNIKNPETKQAKAARSLPADCRIALTGTPVENHVGDLWSIMEFLNPGFLGSQAEFKRTFFAPIQTGADPEAARRLKRLTGPFILRRLKTDKAIIADLPEKMEMKVFCTLTREQASLYEAVVRDAEEALEEAEGIGRRGLVLATLSKLKQVCNHPAQFLGDNSPLPGRSGKLARLSEMLEEALAAGDKALIFSQFAEMGGMIQRHLQETFGREALFLHGGVVKKNRDRMVERFQDAAGPRLFVLSLKAGGTGLNLTAANHVFHFDRWWNPAVENQATDRAFRIGQTRNVQVRKFVCAGTLEEKIDEMIAGKEKLAGSVVGTGEDWLTELSTAELKALFALRKEAVGD